MLKILSHLAIIWVEELKFNAKISLNLFYIIIAFSHDFLEFMIAFWSNQFLMLFQSIVFFI
jgi:hypothetical protein